jgi:hypothetical protein
MEIGHLPIFVAACQPNAACGPSPPVVNPRHSLHLADVHFRHEACRTGIGMLRITVHQDDRTCHLKLAGRLCGHLGRRNQTCVAFLAVPRETNRSRHAGADKYRQRRTRASVGDVSSQSTPGSGGCVDDSAGRGDHRKSANRCPNGAVAEKESFRNPSSETRRNSK